MSNWLSFSLEQLLTQIGTLKCQLTAAKAEHRRKHFGLEGGGIRHMARGRERTSFCHRRHFQLPYVVSHNLGTNSATGNFRTSGEIGNDEERAWRGQP